jgi:hypothetical protein
MKAKTAKAKHNRSDAPETDNFICFQGGTKKDPFWVNAGKHTLNSGLEVVCIDSSGGMCLNFGPKNLRKLSVKLSKWADDMERSTVDTEEAEG